MEFDLSGFLAGRKAAIEALLDAHLPPESRPPALLHKAMRYSVFAGGKRLRPILVMECCRLCGGDETRAGPAAVAVELLHTYSLIHDDLPCMDDDDFRRGRPTSHKVFGEAAAVLAGDALLTAAFGVLAERVEDARLSRKLSAALATAAGASGMVAGQILDMTPPRREPREEYVYFIHSKKTAALMEACCRMGALCAGAGKPQLAALGAFGRDFGLAFQITDDILDEIGDEEKVGKRLRKDRDSGKITYPSVFGLERSRAEAERLVGQAIGALDAFGDEAVALRALARHLLTRVR